MVVGVTRQVTTSRAHYINTHLHQMKVSFETTPKKLKLQNFKRN